MTPGSYFLQGRDCISGDVQCILSRSDLKLTGPSQQQAALWEGEGVTECLLKVKSHFMRMLQAFVVS